MITIRMNQKRRLTDLVRDPWAPSNLMKIRSNRKTPVEPQWTKQQTRSSGLNKLKQNQLTGVQLKKAA